MKRRANDAVVARLAADQSVNIFALREIVGLFVGFVPGEARRTRRRRALIQAITEHRTLNTRQRARAANPRRSQQGVVTASPTFPTRRKKSAISTRA
jgi:hypothetical protein